MNDHDHGDEDDWEVHEDRGHLATDQIDYLLAIGSREAEYRNFRSCYYKAESVHTNICNLSTKAGYFCSCIRGFGRHVTR